jgi:hypothetical protein
MSNLEKLIFVNKNWPNDPRVACKSLCNLVNLIEKNLKFKKKLKKFEISFEWDEIVNIWNYRRKKVSYIFFTYY